MMWADGVVNGVLWVRTFSLALNDLVAHVIMIRASLNILHTGRTAPLVHFGLSSDVNQFSTF